MVRKSIPLMSPDFDNVRASLKTYLQSQDQFNDYDFDGSMLSVLLDLLAYNSHLNIFYYNQLFNESYLSTAITRKAVVNRAQALNYVPQSKTSAQVKITVTGTGLTTPTLVIPNNSVFYATKDTLTFEFRTTKEYETDVINGTATITDIELVEGRSYTYNLPVNNTNRYEIPSKDVDISRLRVFVVDSGAEVEFTRASNIVDLIANQNIYFVQENLAGKYEVYFGDGLIGQAVDSGIVKLQYNISSGSLANGVGAITSTDISTSVIVSVQEAASGGSAADTVSDIKFKAPYSYQAQNRAVIAKDYESLIKDNFNFVEKIIVVPGEELSRPIYGKVFLKIKPYDRLFLTSGESNLIESFIKSKRITTVKPELTNPTYLFTDSTYGLNFSPSASYSQRIEIQTDVANVTENFQTSVDETNNLYTSKLITEVDQVSDLLLSYDVNHTLKKIVPIELNKETTYVTSFGQQITPGSITSNGIKITGNDTSFRISDRNGKLYLTAQNEEYDMGVIDYTTGELTVGPFAIASVSDIATRYVELNNGSTITLYAKPVNFDVDGGFDICLIDKVYFE